MLFRRGFILRLTEKAQVLMKIGTRDFQNSTPFERLACFYVTIIGNFERVHYFIFETDFLEYENFFKKTGAPFLVESTLKMHHFYTKLLYQKPMLREIERRVQNGPVTKNGVLTVTTLFPVGTRHCGYIGFLVDFHRNVDRLRIDIKVTSLYNIFFQTS